MQLFSQFYLTMGKAKQPSHVVLDHIEQTIPFHKQRFNDNQGYRNADSGIRNIENRKIDEFRVDHIAHISECDTIIQIADRSADQKSIGKGTES